MWEMWFIHFMHIEQVYVIYSNLGVYTGGKDNCLCINRREVGLHNSGKGREDLGRLMTVWKDEYVRFPANIVRTLGWIANGQPPVLELNICYSQCLSCGVCCDESIKLFPAMLVDLHDMNYTGYLLTLE